MKKNMVVVIATSALVWGSVAFAAPQSLSSGQLEKVSAGSGMLESFFGDIDLSSPIVFPSDAITTGNSEQGIAIDGDHNVVVGAVAANEGIALNGDDNFALNQDGNIALGLSAAGEGNTVTFIDQSDAGVAAATGGNTHFLLDANTVLAFVDYGSAAVAGSYNDVCIANDDTEINGNIGGNDRYPGRDSYVSGGGYNKEEASYGVVAGRAIVNDSFNSKSVEEDVNADISDSFNTSTNNVKISGQCSLTAIVNASNIYCQAIGTNLNVTSASAESTNRNDTGVGGLINGNAIALTGADQVVLNGALNYQSECVLTGDMQTPVISLPSSFSF